MGQKLDKTATTPTDNRVKQQLELNISQEKDHFNDLNSISFELCHFEKYKNTQIWSDNVLL